MTDPNDMLRALYRNSPSAVIVTNTSRQLVAINPAAERLFGHAEADISGSSVQNFYADPREFDRLGESHFNPSSPEDTRSYVARYRTKSGRVFDGETIASPIIAASGERTGFVCIVRDVTAELSLHAKLEASDVQLRVALTSANEGTFSLNLVSGLGSTRGFINEFLGIKAADATISLARWTEALHESDRDGFHRAIDLLSKRPSMKLDTIYRARRADGVWRWLQTRGRVSEFGRHAAADIRHHRRRHGTAGAGNQAGPARAAIGERHCCGFLRHLGNRSRGPGHIGRRPGPRHARRTQRAGSDQPRVLARPDSPG